MGSSYGAPLTQSRPIKQQTMYREEDSGGVNIVVYVDANVVGALQVDVEGVQ